MIECTLWLSFNDDKKSINELLNGKEAERKRKEAGNELNLHCIIKALSKL